MSAIHAPTRPRPTGGIDRASDSHAVAIVGPDGA